MKALYYTTAEIKALFGWSSNNTIYLKRDSGFLPPPDLEGKPNKWLKSKINAIIDDSITSQKDGA